MAYFSPGGDGSKKSFNVEAIFRDVRILRDKGKLGHGSYGEVFYAKCDSLTCAAKCVSEIFFEVEENEQNKQKLIQDFIRECDLTASMKHPNIVQYLGYYIDRHTGLPCLLMELLDESLTRYLGRLTTPVPFHTSVDFAHDIAMAMDYLHINNIMHRDLSSNNVLIIAGYRAKVSDFGQSTLALPELNYRVQGGKNRCPGTHVYMPPEALGQNPVYSSMLDSFSFGVLLIQILCRQWPNPTSSSTIMPNAGPGNTDLIIPIKEVVRRGNHISMIEPHHPLLQLALYCIDDREEGRPTFLELSIRISEVKEFYEEYQESREHSPAAIGVRPQINRENDERVEELQEQVRQLQKTIDTLESQKVQLQFALEKKDAIIRQLEEDHTHHQRRQPPHQPMPYYQSNSIYQSNHTPHYQSNPTPRYQSNSTPHYQSNPTPRYQSGPSGGAHSSNQYGGQSGSLRGHSSSSSSSVGGTSTSGNRASPLSVNPFKVSGKDYKWYPCNKSPSFLYGGTAMCINNKVYVSSVGLKNIFRFDPSTNVWSDLIPAPVAGFALVEVQGFVTVVGGYTNEGFSNKVFSMMDIDGTYTWDTIFPQMKEPKINAGAIATENYLIVAGGEIEKSTSRIPTDSVELLHIQTSKWYSIDKLPYPVQQPSLSLLSGQLYMVGGITRNNQPMRVMIYARVSELISATQKSFSFMSRSLWRTSSALPVSNTTCVAFNGELLLMGGLDTQITDRIYSMNLNVESNQVTSWTMVGKMAVSRMNAMATELPGQRLMVIGGRGPTVKQVLNVSEMACRF